MRRTSVLLSRHVDGVNDVGGAGELCVAPFLCASFRLWTKVDQLGLAKKKNIELKAKGADLMKLPGASRGLVNTDTRSSRLRRIVLREVPPLCRCEQDGRMTVRYKPYHIEKGHPVTKALQACGAKNWQRQE